MRKTAIGFLLGVWVFQYQSDFPSYYSLFILLPLFLLAIYYSKFRPILALALGFFWSMISVGSQVSDLLLTSLEAKDLFVTGTVDSLPAYHEDRASFEFTIKKMWNLEKGVSKSISAIHYPQRVRLLWIDPAQGLEPGQTWNFLVRLKRPHSYMNPGGFDREQWFFKKGLGASGYILAPRKRHLEWLKQMPPANTLAGPKQSWSLERLRYHLFGSILAVVTDSDHKGLLTALTIGERQHISQDQWRVLSATGTNHLMAISGLHIGLVAGLFFFMGRWLWSLWPVLLLRFPALKAGAISAIGGALIYAAMAGFSIPTQRAVLMVTVVMLSILWQRQFMAGSVLAFALLLVLIVDPLASVDIGFWLSFSAVGVILYASSGRFHGGGWWWRWARIQWMIFLGLFPILLIIYGNISMLSPVANSLAIPWVSFVTVPLALSGTFFVNIIPALGSLLLNLAAISLDFLWPVLQWFAAQKAFQLSFSTPPGWTLIPAVIGLLFLMAPRGLPGKSLAILWFLPLFLLRSPAPEYGQYRLTFLDVGQGLAVVVQTQNHTLVFDTGPQFSSGFNTGDAVIRPFLRHSGIGTIDSLIISHSDTDHIGGARALYQGLRVEKIVTSEPQAVNFSDPARIEDCARYNGWNWDGVRFKILHPSEGFKLKGNNNNRSCVLKVELVNGEGSVLIPGDIEKQAERYLLETSSILKSNILVVPHHGSRTSSTREFLDAVDPQIAFFAVGYRNRYGFPKQEVLQRYQERGVTLYNSATHGAVQLLVRPQGISLESIFRQKQLRYWHLTIRNFESF